MPDQEDARIRLNRLIAEYQHAINTDYGPKYQDVRAQILDTLWHKIHALQIEIVGE